ncbi:MAG: hypothetical protein AAF824_03165 [Bacteroidota bacterium]
MPHSLKKFTANLLSEGNTASVITILQETLHASQPELYNQVIQLSARFKRLEKAVKKGIIDSRDEKLERNQIDFALAELVQEIPEEMTISTELKEVYVRKRNRWIITSLGYLLVMGAVGWLGFMPQKKVYAQLELQVSRIAFRSLNALDIFEGKKVSGLMLQDFEQLKVEASSWDPAGLGDTSRIPSERVVLSLHPQIPGGSAYLDSLRIEEISIMENKQISIEVIPSQDAKEEQGQVQIDFEQSTPSSLRMRYRGALQVATDYLLGKEEENVYEFLGQENITFYCPTTSCELVAQTDTGIQHLYLDTQLGNSYTETEVEVSEISFMRPEDNREVSAILGGTFSLKEPNEEAYQVLALKRNDYLGIKPKEKLTLTELSIVGHEIHIRADGYLERVRAGSEGKSLNPSRLEWLWKNYRFELSAVGILLIIFLVLLPGQISERILTRIERLRGLL